MEHQRKPDCLPRSAGYDSLSVFDGFATNLLTRVVEMAPHLRTHHVCSPPVMASERLGFYLVSGNGERTPFCDVHSFGAALDQSWHNVYYTGPGQKSVTAMTHRRTVGEITAYEKHHEVALENDIAAGGRALFVHSRKRNSYDIWLFGPLSILDHPYGSLIVELSGYAPRKIFSKRDKLGNMTYWTEFPHGLAGHFRPCKLLQSGFHFQAGSTGPPDVEDLAHARTLTSPAILRKPFVRVEWKVESAIVAQTNCALYEQEGL
jgi:hypothetical protein